jgi:RNA polymerase sigma-70 factor, ECF subfamily
VEPHDARSDDALLHACRLDATAFAVFYDRYERAVVGYLARRVHDPELVADLSAEVFAAALGAAGRYRPAEPTAAGWVLTIAHNTLAKSARRRQVEAEARRRLGIRDAVSFEDDELDRVEALAGEDGWLQTLLDHLPPEQADAIRARVLDEHSYTEIAAEMATSELVIRKRVSRGLASLRQELGTRKRS